MTKILRPFTYAPPQDALTIIYQDDDLVVLSKPAGLLSVPGRKAEHKDSLEVRTRDVFPSARLIHRLDMATSGLMIMALSKAAQSNLAKQFQDKIVQKTYIALVWGKPTEESGLVDLPLIADWPNRPLQKVDLQDGKPSQTQWRVIAREADYTRMELKPITGRSHQLRVHMNEMGHPILGDDFYAHSQAQSAQNRLCLHASALNIKHPNTGIEMSFQDPPPF